MIRHTTLVIVMMAASCAPKDPYVLDLTSSARTPGNRATAFSLNGTGMDYHRKQQFDQAREYFYKAAMADRSWVTPVYNLACAYSLLRKIGPAIELLKVVLDMDSSDAMVSSILSADSDLTNVRNSSEFPAFRKIYIDGNFQAFVGKPLTCGRSSGFLSYNLTLRPNSKVEGDASAGGATYSTECVGGSWKITDNILSITLKCKYQQVGGFGVPGISPPGPPDQVMNFKNPAEVKEFFSNKKCDVSSTYTM